jgi:hypothetical protein
MEKIMLKKNKFTFLSLVLIAWVLSLGFMREDPNDKNKSTLNKPNTNDFYTYIAINQIKMYISNNGDGSYEPVSGAQGFFWPGGENAQVGAIFEDGLLWGGKVGGEVRVNGSVYRHGLQAGPINALTGKAEDPSDPLYRVYKVRKDWESLPSGAKRDSYQKDYEEWPWQDGAPSEIVNGKHVPKFTGDEMLWYVSNDLDPVKTAFTYGTKPIGLEEQCLTFGFNRTGDMGDIVFKRYRLINKGTNVIDSMYLGAWSDTDLGEANDDFTGSDTLLSLGYTYNSTNYDSKYGKACPAVGYDFFQGPLLKGIAGKDINKNGVDDASDYATFNGELRGPGFVNLPMTAFAFYVNSSTYYRDPTQGTAAGAQEFYYYLKGQVWNGTNFIDPFTQKPTKFVLTGDPVTKTGWYEGPVGWPGAPFTTGGDRRHLMSSGPFVMNPGDTQEVVVATIIARGSSNLKSIKELKIKDAVAQFAYTVNFNLPPAPPKPKVNAYIGEKTVTLWWDDLAESYNNPFYKFEGFRIWEFKDATGANPVVKATYDLDNGIGAIEDYVSINDERVKAPVIIGENSGLRHFITINSSEITNSPLINGTPYYFAVTAYGAAKSDATTPQFLESTPDIVEYIPTEQKIDLTIPFVAGEHLVANKSFGLGDGEVIFKIVDPLALTGNKYSVVISGPDSLPVYSLINKTKGDTLLRNMTDFGMDTISKKIIDGFMVLVVNVGKDSIVSGKTLYRVKSVLETSNGKGLLANPINTLTRLNSTGKWKVRAGGTGAALGKFTWQAKDSDLGLGFKDYEIRFSGTSDFYVSKMLIAPKFATNEKLGKLAPLDSSNIIFTLGMPLPFTIYELGATPAADTRLLVKILDGYANPNDSTRAIPDSLWSRTKNRDWEEIYAYSDVDIDANGVLPASSGTSVQKDHRFGQFIFTGELPEQGTIVKIVTYKPLASGDAFEATLTMPNKNNLQAAKNNLDKISVYPNPYFGANSLERDKYQRFVRFTNLPKDVSIRIYTLAGTFVQKITKNDDNPYADWNLRNSDGLPVGSGMYIAYLDMPNIGSKVLKIAIIQETQYIDRL